MSVAKRLQNMGKKKEVTLIASDAELVGDITFPVSWLLTVCRLEATAGLGRR